MRKRYVFDPKAGKMVPVQSVIDARAPWVHRGAKDPTSADVAVPRAFRQLEQQHSASRIARDAGWSVDTIKRTWNM
jgi:hypothetical protein